MKREKFDLDYWAPLEPGEEERYAASVGGNGGAPLAAPAAGEGRYAASVGGNGGAPLAAPAAGEGRYAASHSAGAVAAVGVGAERCAIPGEACHDTQLWGDVERVVKAVEEARVDIAPSYAEWRDLGFALASEFGMDGLDFYQRLSQFHPSYTEQEAAKQYVACCNSRGSGITIRTLFGLAKNCGVSLRASGGERCAAPVAGNGGAPLAAPAVGGERYAAPVAGSAASGAVGADPERCAHLERFADPERYADPGEGEGRYAASVGDNGGAPLDAPAAGEGRYAASVGANGGAPLAAPGAGEERFAAYSPLTPAAGGCAVAVASYDDEEECETEVAMVKMPTIVGQVKEKLPPFLQRIVEMGYDDEEKDMLLLGSMTTMSACLPNVYGVYDSNELYPNLFMFLFAPPSSGKGRLTLCETLVSQIDRAMIEESARAKEDYDARAAQKASEGKLLAEKEPEKKMLLIPANASSTAVYQVLNNNGGVGLMFETEGDTLNNTLKTDYGNFSDGFRKAFHHERISYLRRKDSEHVSIEKPKLSVLLSGTPEQMHGLIRDTENGLFSRFMFYCMSIRNEWRNPFGGDRSMTLRERFYQLGTEFFRFYNRLKYKHPMEFVYSEEQTERFNAAFSDMQGECLDAFGADIVASVRRLAVITFRLSMVMTTLRHIDDEELPCVLECDERDFEAALLMAKTLLHHTARVYDTLPQAPTASEGGVSSELDRFYRELPIEFCRTQYVEVGTRQGYCGRTADRMVKRLCLKGMTEKLAKNRYRKVEKKAVR